MFKVGEEIIVSDPCYDEDGVCNYIAKAKSGDWKIEVVEDDGKKELVAKHIECGEKEWKLVSTDICVDSGMVGLYDREYYQAKDRIRNEERFELQKRWLLENEEGKVGRGCVVKVKFGGCFDLYAMGESELEGLRLVLA